MLLLEGFVPLLLLEYTHCMANINFINRSILLHLSSLSTLRLLHLLQRLDCVGRVTGGTAARISSELHQPEEVYPIAATKPCASTAFLVQILVLQNNLCKHDYFNSAYTLQH